MIANALRRMQEDLSGLLPVFLLALAMLATPGAGQAQSYGVMSCDELWYARNAIFAEKGYCFKTARAIQTFGPRCYPPYGKLNAGEQAEVDFIRSVEARKGCSSGDGGGGSTGGGFSPYAAMSCDQLWYERNAIYAAKGYCFKTERAIRTFGPGCYPPYGKLNAGEQSRVNEIQTWEQRKGCR